MNYLEIAILVSISVIGIAVFSFLQRRKIWPQPEKEDKFVELVISYRFQGLLLLIGIPIGIWFGTNSPVLTSFQILLFIIAAIGAILLSFLRRAFEKIFGFYFATRPGPGGYPSFIYFGISGICIGCIIPSLVRLLLT